jgi:predicted transcriptional regulator
MGTEGDQPVGRLRVCIAVAAELARGVVGDLTQVARKVVGRDILSLTYAAAAAEEIQLAAVDAVLTDELERAC